MTELLPRLLSCLANWKKGSFRLAHMPEAISETSYAWFQADCLVVGVPSSSFYLQGAEALAAAGVRHLDLLSWAWWLGEGDPPQAAVVADHIACHRPSPLTGSAQALRGEAFISMEKAYTMDGVSWVRAVIDEVMPVVVWHTEGAKLDREELDVARQAGCLAAGPCVAPWAAVSRAKGINLTALVLPRLWESPRT